MQRRDLIIVGTILAGGVILAIALFTVLRPDATGRPPGLPTGSTDITAQVRAQTQAALARRRVGWTQRCWTPSVTRTPTPDRISFTLDTTFDRTGKQIARGFIEPRDGRRADVFACLRSEPLDITIPPPGTTVRVEVPVTLP